MCHCTVWTSSLTYRRVSRRPRSRTAATRWMRGGVVDGDGDGERLVVVPRVDDGGAGAGDAGASHDILVGQVAPDEVDVRAVGQRVLADVVPRAEHHLETPVGGQLGDDPLGAPGVVAEQDDVVGEIQRDHTSRAPAPDRLQGRGELGEQQGQRDDAADDDVDADEPAAGRHREDVAVAHGGRGDDEVPPVGARRGDVAADRFEQRHRAPTGQEHERRHGQRHPPAAQADPKVGHQAEDQERQHGLRRPAVGQRNLPPRRGAATAHGPRSGAQYGRARRAPAAIASAAAAAVSVPSRSRERSRCARRAACPVSS